MAILLPLARSWPHLSDADTHIVSGVFTCQPPDRTYEVTMGDDLPHMVRKILQQCVFGRRQVDFEPVDRNQTALKVQSQPIGLKSGAMRAPTRLGYVAKRHTDTRQQLHHAKRFGDVVISAFRERLDFVRLAVAHREDDDRHGGPRAEPVTSFKTIHIWQQQF